MRILGVILAGGSSSRMGGDKASLKIGGVSLLSNAFNNMQECHEIVLASNNIALPDDIPSCKIIPDASDKVGPLAGVFSGLEFAKENGFDMVQFCPCDTPLVKQKIFSNLKGGIEDAECCVPESTTGMHPLHALVKTAEAITSFDVGKVGNSAHSLVKSLEYNTIFVEDRIMLNINTPEDLAEIN